MGGRGGARRRRGDGVRTTPICSILPRRIGGRAGVPGAGGAGAGSGASVLGFLEAAANSFSFLVRHLGVKIEGRDTVCGESSLRGEGQIAALEEELELARSRLLAPGVDQVGEDAN